MFERYLERLIQQYVRFGTQGYYLELPDGSPVALALSWALVRLDVASGHRLCESAEWLDHLPLGWPHYEGEGADRFLVNSWGGRLYQLMSWAICTAP